MYEYDFGDGWRHTITVEDVIFNYDKNYAYCLEGSGDAPPEDVGGEGGYEWFVEVTNNPSHPEYEHLSTWAIHQGYENFSITDLNRRLKYIY